MNPPCKGTSTPYISRSLFVPRGLGAAMIFICFLLLAQTSMPAARSAGSTAARAGWCSSRGPPACGSPTRCAFSWQAWRRPAAKARSSPRRLGGRARAQRRPQRRWQGRRAHRARGRCCPDRRAPSCDPARRAGPRDADETIISMALLVRRARGCCTERQQWNVRETLLHRQRRGEGRKSRAPNIFERGGAAKLAAAGCKFRLRVFFLFAETPRKSSAYAESSNPRCADLFRRTRM